jgi:2-iminobutanoate/2-iminopropanoate deaminase
MDKSAIYTDRAPGPSHGAPYSQAVRYGDLVFVSGQLPVDPSSGSLVDGGIGEQTRQVMENLSAVLEAAGSGVSQLLKTTVYLTDRGNWAAMNEIYANFLGDVPPARSAVISTELGFGALVELEAIAYIATPA